MFTYFDCQIVTSRWNMFARSLGRVSFCKLNSFRLTAQPLSVIHKFGTSATPRPLKNEKDKSQIDRVTEFIDFKKVRVKGGKGGDGMICFLHLFCNDKAGPSGGDGGNGGHIIFESCSKITSLNHLKSVYNGNLGENGMHKDMFGANAEHTFIKVPVGTIIKNEDGRIIADMNVNGMNFLAAKGGAGGKGNHYFLSNRNRHPRVAEIGANGESRVLTLELKMIAHAGLVGFPNAGKSTLLQAVSRARPKVASYPFTTLKPSIGVIQFEDDVQLTIADLPGLIEDAHKNRGLGFDFLKHVERCVCLMYVIDISAPDPYEQFKILMSELRFYQQNLDQRPKTIILNKMDVNGSENKLEMFKENLKKDNLSHLKVLPVSAKYGGNISTVLTTLRELYDIHNLATLMDEEL